MASEFAIGQRTNYDKSVLKLEFAKTWLKEVSVKEGWDTSFTFGQILHKIDSLTKIAKRRYAKFNKEATIGLSVEDLVDFEVSFQFQFYFTLEI